MRLKFIIPVLFFLGGILYSADFLITPTKIDLGDVVWGGVKNFRITIINNSDRPYHITRMVKYCSCISLNPNFTKKTVPPHSTLIINGTFYARVLGYFGKTIEIYTDHPLFQKVVIDIEGRVYYPQKLPRIEVEPRNVNLGLLLPGEKREFKIRVRNKGNGVLKVVYSGFKNVEGGSNSIEVPPLKGIEVAFRFQENHTGPFKKIIWFVSNDPITPRVPVLVTGKVVEIGGEGGVTYFKKLYPLFAFLAGFTLIIYAGIKYFTD